MVEWIEDVLLGRKYIKGVVKHECANMQKNGVETVSKFSKQVLGFIDS